MIVGSFIFNMRFIMKFSDLTKEKLYDLYITQNLMRKEIAEKFDVDEGEVKFVLRSFGIKKPKNLHLANIKRSCIEKYGVPNGGWTKESQKKIKETMNRKYGVDWYLSSEENKKKYKESLMKNYGVINNFQREECKKKAKETMLERYGYEYNMQIKEVVIKCNTTKRNNGTFNSSSEEDRVYEKLMERFPDVKRQYSSKLYPFNCDFYIPSLDLYIEHQGYCSHGGHPFNPDDDKDAKRLEVLKKKSKNSKFYKNLMRVWTIKDPLKRETAKKNNLNWLEFFTMQEFENWLKGYAHD